jgi:hypothetical protein
MDIPNKRNLCINYRKLILLRQRVYVDLYFHSYLNYKPIGVKKGYIAPVKPA